ncbi:MAG: hypothetical protein A2Y09_05545 [Planctomycetes bacterium GWA2_39_15]|nr:MAG: hypothetical protein A2Y09_05545 [Planctomycetes bacterium GWA2_39_15]
MKILILLNKEIYETNKKTIAKNAILRTAKNTAANLLRLTGKLLQESGFENIKDLNKEESANTQDFDFIAERNNIKYLLNLLIERIAVIIVNFKRICYLVYRTT